MACLSAIRICRLACPALACYRRLGCGFFCHDSCCYGLIGPAVPGSSCHLDSVRGPPSFVGCRPAQLSRRFCSRRSESAATKTTPPDFHRQKFAEEEGKRMHAPKFGRGCNGASQQSCGMGRNGESGGIAVPEKMDPEKLDAKNPRPTSTRAHRLPARAPGGWRWEKPRKRSRFATSTTQ